jgi:hypothetical protein
LISVLAKVHLRVGTVILHKKTGLTFNGDPLQLTGHQNEKN